MLMLCNYAYGQGTGTENEPFNYFAWIAGIIGTIGGGSGGYLLNRYFVNKDFEFQKQIEHEKWLLQRFNNLADTYYVPLAKFSFDARSNISRAIISKDPLAIKVAYYHVALFLTKYLEFKNTIGANFLLKPQSAENEAIISIRAILGLLPFDDLDLIKIENDVKKSNMSFSEQHFKRNTFKYFKNWIESDHCYKSRQLILDKLNQLQGLLDATSEQINHPEVARKEIVKISPAKNYDSPFYILFSSTKHIKKNESIVLFGGFELDKLQTCGFFIGQTQLTIESIDNDTVRLRMPNGINNGVYDVIGTFIISQTGNSDETVGIPINIV